MSVIIGRHLQGDNFVRQTSVHLQRDPAGGAARALHEAGQHTSSVPEQHVRNSPITSFVCLKSSIFPGFIFDSEAHVWICFASTRSEPEEKNLEKTVFTVCDITDGTVTWREKRPALLISSTSWTGENRRIKLLLFLLCQSLGF